MQRLMKNLHYCCCLFSPIFSCLDFTCCQFSNSTKKTFDYICKKNTIILEPCVMMNNENMDLKDNHNVYLTTNAPLTRLIRIMREKNARINKQLIDTTANIN